jgi:transposase-like protein
MADNTKAKPMISTAQAQRELQRRGILVDQRTVQRWCKTGVLRAQRFGKRGAWKVDADSIG